MENSNLLENSEGSISEVLVHFTESSSSPLIHTENITLFENREQL